MEPKSQLSLLQKIAESHRKYKQIKVRYLLNKSQVTNNSYSYSI